MNLNLALKQPWGQITLSVVISLVMATYLVFFEILPNQSQISMIKQQSNLLRVQIQRMKSAPIPTTPIIPQDALRKAPPPAPSTRLLGKIRKQGETYCVFMRDNHITLNKAGTATC